MGPQPWTKELAPRFVYSEAFARITAIRAAVAQEIQSLPTCAHKFNFILLHWEMKSRVDCCNQTIALIDISTQTRSTSTSCARQRPAPNKWNALS
jgi:hypothetical protein